jgi:hypothetical protein
MKRNVEYYMVNPDLSIKPHKEAVKGCLDYWHKRIYLKRKQTLEEVLKIMNKEELKCETKDWLSIFCDSYLKIEQKLKAME